MRCWGRAYDSWEKSLIQVRTEVLPRQPLSSKCSAHLVLVRSRTPTTDPALASQVRRRVCVEFRLVSSSTRTDQHNAANTTRHNRCRGERALVLGVGAWPARAMAMCAPRLSRVSRPSCWATQRYRGWGVVDCFQVLGPEDFPLPVGDSRVRPLGGRDIVGHRGETI